MNAASSKRRQFALWQLLASLGVLAVVLAIFLAFRRESLEVRAADGHDERESYIPNQDATRALQACSVSGRFFSSTRFTISLYEIRNGKTNKCSTLSCSKSTNQVAFIPWETMTISVALLESTDEDLGEAYWLAVSGSSRVSAHNAAARFPGVPRFDETFDQTLTTSREVVLHVVGDSEFEGEPGMSVDEFAASNPGEFLVITGWLNGPQ